MLQLPVSLEGFRKLPDVQYHLYFYYYTNELSYLQLISFSAARRDMIPQSVRYFCSRIGSIDALMIL